jgi:hypothetical protein
MRFEQEETERTEILNILPQGSSATWQIICWRLAKSGG